MAHDEKPRILFIGNDIGADCYLATELERFGFEIEYLSSEVELVLNLVADGKKADFLLIAASPDSFGAIIDQGVLAKIRLPVLVILPKTGAHLAERVWKDARRECIEDDSSPAEFNLRIKKLLRDFNRGDDSPEGPIDAFALHEIILDADGKPVDYRFLDADSKFLKRIGKTREELIGKTVMELYPKTERVWIETFGRVALTGVPEVITQYSTEFNRYFEARAYSSEKNKFLVLFLDLDKMRGAYK